jgi:hypothetical protein
MSFKAPIDFISAGPEPGGRTNLSDRGKTRIWVLGLWELIFLPGGGAGTRNAFRKLQSATPADVDH